MGKIKKSVDSVDSAGPEGDDALDATAQGFAPTSDDGVVVEDGDEDEIDTMGEAAGIPMPDGAVLGGGDVIARRDAHRWELDPDSAEDTETRDR